MQRSLDAVAMNDSLQPPPDAPPFTLLCVDDEPNILSALRRLFRPVGYQVLVAGSGAEALEILEREPVDLIISDMRMPVMDGASLLAIVRERWPQAIRILLTGYADMTSTIAAINRGEIFRYISKPWDDPDVLLVVKSALERKELEREKARLEALTIRQNEELKALNASLEQKVEERTAELKQANDRLKQNFLVSIKMFSGLIELREGGVAGHSRRVADLCRKLAARLELDTKAQQDVFLAALLHDIGKIGFPDALLAKPVSSMSSEDMGRFRKHPLAGEAALMPLNELKEAAKVVRSHHERFDGQGFPDGVQGFGIPVGARILAVVNDYDALINGMLSAKRMTPEEAKALLVQSRNKRYDAQVVDAFIEMLGGLDKEQFKDLILPATSLEPGMVLARDLISREGTLLLAADYMLDATLIRQIQEYGAREGVQITLHIRNDRR
ncbi:MAG TPA: HD domain-containing phosphohydrolase [Rhodocyclaceae bacterium]|nr:HD domain-containing phosphohydrolase [Rhodocyclaceae bacterium]